VRGGLPIDDGWHSMSYRASRPAIVFVDRFEELQAFSGPGSAVRLIHSRDIATSSDEDVDQ
jgi:hypothetical protein